MVQALSRTEVQHRHLRQLTEVNDNGRSSLITKMAVIEKCKLRVVCNICLTEALHDDGSKMEFPTQKSRKKESFLEEYQRSEVYAEFET
jgi:hypothetical protein